MKKLLISLLVVSLIAVSMFSLVACKETEKEVHYYDVDPTADNLVSIKTADTIQTMEGFGASSCWWSQVVGGQEEADEIAEMLYGDSGLAMSIYRYNIGGGSSEVEDIAYDQIDRESESFLNAKDYTGSTHAELLAFVSDESNYDFTKDANAQKMFEKCYAKGNIKNIVLFVNSPNYIMTKNGKTHSTQAGKDNLDEENFDVFATYLMVILKYFVVEKGYPVTYLSPINEPQWDWGGSGASQEGCHYEPASCAKCLDVVNTALKEFNRVNNTSVKLDGFESGNWNDKPFSSSKIKKYLDAMAEYDYFDEIDHVSFHSYYAPESKAQRENTMTNLERYGYSNIQIAISEFCQMSRGIDMSFKTAQYLGLVMSYDISVLNASEWTWWIGVSNPNTYWYNDGFVYYDWWDEGSEVYLNPRAYMMEHFAKFVMPGDKRVDVKFDNQVSLLTAADKLSNFYSVDGTGVKMTDDLYNVFIRADGTVIIVYNNVTPYDYTWSFNDQFGTFEAYTSTDGNYMVKTEGNCTGSYTFAKNSITTLILK